MRERISISGTTTNKKGVGLRLLRPTLPLDALYLGTMSLGRNIEMQSKGTIQKAFSTRAFTLYFKTLFILSVIYNTYSGYPQVIHRLWKSVYGALPDGNGELTQLTLK